MTDEETTPFKISLPVELKAKLQKVAKNDRRSLTSEIILRLEKSFEPVILQTTYNAGEAESLVLTLQNKYKTANFVALPLNEMQSDLDELLSGVQQLNTETSSTLNVLSECAMLQANLHRAIMIRVAEAGLKETNE